MPLALVTLKGDYRPQLVLPGRLVKGNYAARTDFPVLHKTTQIKWPHYESGAKILVNPAFA